MVVLTANLLRQNQSDKRVLVIIPDKIYMIGVKKRNIQVEGKIKCEDSWWSNCPQPQIKVSLELHENINGIVKNISGIVIGEEEMVLQFHKSNHLFVSVEEYPPHVTKLTFSKEF